MVRRSLGRVLPPPFHPPFYHTSRSFPAFHPPQALLPFRLGGLSLLWWLLPRQGTWRYRPRHTVQFLIRRLLTCAARRPPLQLVFPPEYPMKPPAIYMITPNGRFHTNTRWVRARQFSSAASLAAHLRRGLFSTNNGRLLSDCASASPTFTRISGIPRYAGCTAPEF